MDKLNRRALLLLVLAFLMNLQMFAQCSPSERYCLGMCRPARDCAPGNPPPPGLVVPIDSNIYVLMFAGLGLGGYFLVSSRKKSNN